MRRGQPLIRRIIPLLMSLALASAQTDFKVNVRLVRLMINVKNPAGELVGSLEKDEFSVFDNGVEQQIANFEHYTNPVSYTHLRAHET